MEVTHVGLVLDAIYDIAGDVVAEVDVRNTSQLAMRIEALAHMAKATVEMIHDINNNSLESLTASGKAAGPKRGNARAGLTINHSIEE